MITWVIENFIDNDKSTQLLINEILNQKYNCVVINKNINIDTLHSISDNHIIFKGCIQTAEKISLTYPEWSPGVIATWEKYNCNFYYPILSDFLLNKNYKSYTIKQFKEEKWDIYRLFGKDSKIWIRPNSCKKIFPALLLDLEDFDRYYKNWFSDLDPNEHIIISTPKEINGEWRFVVSSKEILTYSSYLYQQNRIEVPSAPYKSIEITNEILKELFVPDEFFIIDICEDRQGNCYLMELNAFSTSGLYACKMEPIVYNISKYYLL